jgi:hypothetical protein
MRLRNGVRQRDSGRAGFSQGYDEMSPALVLQSFWELFGMNRNTTSMDTMNPHDLFEKIPMS